MSQIPFLSPTSSVTAALMETQKYRLQAGKITHKLQPFFIQQLTPIHLQQLTSTGTYKNTCTKAGSYRLLV